MKKYYVFIIILLIVFTTFLLIKYVPKNYILNYKFESYNVKEQYIKNEKEYLFNITYKKLDYPILLSKKYTTNRKLISKIAIKKENNIVCLDINIDNKVYPTCSYDNELIDYRTLNDSFLKKNYKITKKEPEKINNYKKINVFNYKNNNFLIWNYKGFYLLTNNKNETINILKNDEYENELTYQYDNYLIIPDYDSKYYFSKVYVYDVKTLKENSFSFNYEISYDSYFLGFYKNEFYLVDKKNGIEYSINVKNQKIKIISKNGYGKIWNNKWDSISMTKLINKKYAFINTNNYNFEINNKSLYMIIDHKKIKISNNKVDKILSIKDCNVYYLEKDKLYTYNFKDGESLLLQYSEWNFNNNNQIYIFN